MLGFAALAEIPIAEEPLIGSLTTAGPVTSMPLIKHRYHMIQLWIVLLAVFLT